jgi:putative transposase
MRKSRFTEAQIVGILKELDAGMAAADVARKHGVHVNTLRLWRGKYGGLDVSDLVRLKELETENSRMERIIARQVLELHAMSEVIRKNGWGPQRGGKR